MRSSVVPTLAPKLEARRASNVAMHMHTLDLMKVEQVKVEKEKKLKSQSAPERNWQSSRHSERVTLPNAPQGKLPPSLQENKGYRGANESLLDRRRAEIQTSEPRMMVFGLPGSPTAEFRKEYIRRELGQHVSDVGDRLPWNEAVPNNIEAVVEDSSLYAQFISHHTEPDFDKRTLTPRNSIPETQAATPEDKRKLLKLRKAAYSGHADVVEQLLQEGVSPNEEDEYGRTVLMRACSKGNKEVVEKLLEAGVDINYASARTGNTALQYAMLTENWEFQQFLLEKGADPTLVNSMGNNARNLESAMRGKPEDVGFGPLATKMALAPAQPEPVQCVSRRATDMTVKWTAPLDNGFPITSYHVRTRPCAQIDDDQKWELATPTMDELQGYGLLQKFDCLLALTKYEVQVAAKSMNGLGPFSESKIVSTGAAGEPEAPTVLGKGVGHDWVGITWNKPKDHGSPVLSYVVEWASASSLFEDTGFPGEQAPDKTEFKMKGLEPLTEYKFRVAAINAVGRGNFSPEFKVNTAVHGVARTTHMEWSQHELLEKHKGFSTREFDRLGLQRSIFRGDLEDHQEDPVADHSEETDALQDRGEPMMPTERRKSLLKVPDGKVVSTPLARNIKVSSS